MKLPYLAINYKPVTKDDLWTAPKNAIGIIMARPFLAMIWDISGDDPVQIRECLTDVFVNRNDGGLVVSLVSFEGIVFNATADDPYYFTGEKDGNPLRLLLKIRDPKKKRLPMEVTVETILEQFGVDEYFLHDDGFRIVIKKDPYMDLLIMRAKNAGGLTGVDGFVMAHKYSDGNGLKHLTHFDLNWNAIYSYSGGMLLADADNDSCIIEVEPDQTVFPYGHRTRFSPHVFVDMRMWANHWAKSLRVQGFDKGTVKELVSCDIPLSELQAA